VKLCGIKTHAQIVKSILVISTFFVMSFSSLNAQCTISSSGCGGYNVQISMTPTAILPSSYSCPYGYNYNVQFIYSIIVSGINTCYNGNIGVQNIITCNSQNNTYNTILIPAPIVGNPIITSTYTGTLTTGSNSYNPASDCNTVTPTSLNCNTLQVTVYGPGIPTATYPCTIVPTPIELLSFTGQCKGNNVVLKWSTATETNNDFFTIEHSIDGISWIIAGKIKGAGNSTTILNYAFTDTTASGGISYYRLKQTDYNGNYKYNEIINVKNCNEDVAESTFTVYPNPSNGIFNLLFKGDEAQVVLIEVYTLMGELIFSYNGYQSIIDLSGKYSGVCFFRLTQNNKTVTTTKLVSMSGLD
jgi:hypothetical protein